MALDSQIPGLFIQKIYKKRFGIMIKPGVKIYGLRPEMAYCAVFVERVLNKHGIERIPASVTGKKHGRYSLHPVGFAEDDRTKHVMGSPEQRREILDQVINDLRKAVPQCDFVLEHFGQAQEHIHWEFDPKDDEVFQRHKAIYRQTGEWPDN